MTCPSAPQSFELLQSVIAFKQNQVDNGGDDTDEISKLRKEHIEKERMLTKMLQKSDAQLSLCNKRESTVTKKFRQIIEKQQTMLSEMEVKLQGNRKRHAQMLTEIDCLRQTEKTLRQKYNKIVSETRGIPADEVPNSIPETYTPSDNIKELLLVKSENEELRNKLSEFGHFEPSQRLGILSSLGTVKYHLKRTRETLGQIRICANEVESIITDYIKDSFPSDIEEWYEQGGESQPRKDATKLTIAAARLVVCVISKMTGCLTSVPGERGRLWKDDSMVKELRSAGVLIDKSAREHDEVYSSSSMSSGSLTGVCRVLEHIVSGMNGILEFQPRFWNDFVEKTRPGIAFGRANERETPKKNLTGPTTTTNPSTTPRNRYVSLSSTSKTDIDLWMREALVLQRKIAKLTFRRLADSLNISRIIRNCNSEVQDLEVRDFLLKNLNNALIHGEHKLNTERESIRDEHTSLLKLASSALVAWTAEQKLQDRMQVLEESLTVTPCKKRLPSLKEPVRDIHIAEREGKKKLLPSLERESKKKVSYESVSPSSFEKKEK